MWRLGISLFLFVQFFFIIPLLGTGFFIYQAGTALRNNDTEAASRNISIAQPLFSTTKASYTLSRPAFLLLFVSLVPENMISIEDNAITFIKTSLDTQTKVHELNALILKTGKTPQEIDTTRILISQVNNNINTLTDSSGNLKDLIDYPFSSTKSLQKNFEDIHSYLETLQKLTTHADDLIGGNTSKKYLFFFYNNMELRPGGGFIGSFAIVEFKNYSFYDFQVYDVYDADGQLKAHVEPPRAIRDHLDQPNWFLRDSNFNPDFAENVTSAEFFLQKELALSDFDGYVGITTTALTYLLEAFGDLYIPDFNEKITAENFYLKAQLQSEGEFFPGSTRKKSYLSTIGGTLMLNIQDASPIKLGVGIKKAFDEKHIVFLSKNPDLQADIDSMRWSGKVSLPQCLSGSNNCIINHIFSIDANLGVNKANYFVNKSVHLQTDIDAKGNIENILSTTFINTSASDVFPGGTYKNYYQMYLPTRSDVKNIEIDGTPVYEFDETSSGHFKIIGVLVETPPKGSSVVNIEYTLADPIEKGSHSYQLVVQKQIGAFNNDFSFELNLPDNIFVTNQNFASLAKKGRVVYNTDLSTDRIFVIDMVRE